MLNKQFIEQISANIQKIIPADLGVIKADIETVIRVEMMALLEKMDLVTREEFDIQTAVLLKTRQKLETLEEQVKQIETQLK